MKNENKKSSKENSEDANEEKVLVDEVVTDLPIASKNDLLRIYKALKDLGINSIGDLEVKISRL